jgi:glycosyltransferase involved in cell wall biosynthesis
MTVAFNTFVPMGNQQKIIVTVSNDLSTDQRVRKMCNSLLKKGYEIELLGRVQKKSLPIDRPYKVKRFKLFFNKGALFYANLNIRLFFYLLFHRFDRIHANDLDTLLPALIISKFKGKKLVYDSHEIFTEVPEIQGRWVKKIWQWIENFSFHRLNNIITVNQSIADFYEKKFGKEIQVIRNIPEARTLDLNKDRTSLSLPENPYIVISQGSGINIDRGNEELLESIKLLDDVLLLFVGSGDAIPRLKELSKTLDIQSKVRFIDRMPYEKMINYTACADLGISFDKASNLNYLYSLPNKIFDYISAGTPILASNLPEVSNIINTYGVGLLIENITAKEIANGITEMRSKKADYWDDSLAKASKELTWESESKALNMFY